MTSSLRKIRQNLGLPAKAITSGLQLPEFGSIEELDAFRDAALAEQQRDGFSPNVVIWQEALRRGLDQSLPSLREITGLASDSREVLQESLAALKSSKQAFDPEQMDPKLQGLQFNGKPIEDADAHEVLDFLHSSMADSAPSERGELLELIDAVKSSPFGTTTNSVEINLPDRVQTFEVNSDQESSDDWYQSQYERSQQQQPQEGLGGLMINPGGQYQVTEADHAMFSQGDDE